jgi:hypothetical protein
MLLVREWSRCHPRIGVVNSQAFVYALGRSLNRQLLASNAMNIIHFNNTNSGFTS